MSDFLQRHVRAISIGAIVVYILSMAPWFMWVLLMFFGAGYGSATLTTLALIAAFLYPVTMVVSFFAGWRFRRHNQSKKVLMAVIAPLLYVPIMIIVGVIALLAVN